MEQFRFKSKPSNAEKDYFLEYGSLYIKGFYDYDSEIRPIQKDIFDLIELLAEQYKITLPHRSFSPDRFDDGLALMVRDHRPVVAVLYDAVKKLPNYVRLAASPKHDLYCRALLDSKFVGFANRGYGIRMDNPGEDSYSTQLHQDYVSQLCSQNGAVLWSPLRDVTRELGPVVYYPGSHRSGVFPILKLSHGSRGLVIDGAEDIAARYKAVQPEVWVGDCVVIHALLLHESGRNVSDHTRWSMISRYFDFTDASGRAINWKGGLQDGNSFEQVHPELTRRDSRP
jgi:hypothetical protein